MLSENISTLIYVDSLLNAIRCINQKFVFKNSNISCLVLIFNRWTCNIQERQSASVTDLKRIETPHSLCCDFWGYKPLQLVGQAAQFKFESKFEPLQVIWQSLGRLFQKVIEGLEGKVNGQALGAALLLCLGGSDGRAQTQVSQDASESAAVAAVRDRLAWGKHATTLAILTQFKSQFKCIVNFGQQRVTFFFMWNEISIE